MTTWEALASSLKFPGEKEMWEEFYTNRKLSVNTLATKFASSPHTIRRRLEATGVSVRKRGGPNSQKLFLTQDVIDSVAKIGVRATAKNLGITPQALYGRLYYKNGLRVRDLKSVAPSTVETQSEAGDANAEPSTDPTPPQKGR